MAVFMVFETLRERIGNSVMLTRFVGAASWSLFGSVVTNGASLVTTVLVARILGKESFGHFVALQTTVLTISMASWFGVGFAANRYAADLARRDPGRLGRILGLSQIVILITGVIAIASLAGAADAIAQHGFRAPEIGAPIAIAAVSILFLSFDGFQKNILIGLSEMRAFAWSSILGAALSIPVTIALTYRYGLTGAAIAVVAGSMANCAISWVWSRSKLGKLGIVLSWRDSGREMGTMLHFALPALLTGLLPAGANWIVQSLLARAGSAGEVAVFGIAMQWFHLVNFLPGAMARALMPIMTESVRDGHATRRTLLAGVAASTLVAAPIALGGAILSPYIMESYGPQFAGSQAALAIAMGVAVVHAAQLSVQQLIAAREHMWIAIAMTLAMTTVFVGASIILVPYGATGAAAALAAGYLFQAGASLAYGSMFLRNARMR